MKKINNILIYLFNITFTIIFTFITFYAIFEHRNIKKFSTFFVIIATLITCVGIYFIFKTINNAKFKNIKLIKKIIFIIMISIQLIFGFKCRIVSSWDSGVTMDVSSRIADGRYDGDSTTYFSMYNNNIPFVTLLTIIFKFVHLFFGANSKYMGVVIVINILLIDIGVYLVQKIVQEIYGEKNSLFALLFMFFLSPLYCYAPIIYTDTFTFLFPPLIMYIYILSNKENISFKRKTLYSVLIGIITFIGMRLKITVLFILIAIFITEFLRIKFEKRELKNYLFRYLIIFITIIILFIGKNLYYSKFINYKLDNNKKFPYTHWIMMGLGGEYGAYLDEDVNFTKSFENEELKKAANIEVIKNRLNDKLRNNFNFFIKKINFVWGDGTYYSNYKLVRGSYEKNIFHEFVTKDGKYYKYYSIVVQSIHFAMLIFITMSSFFAIFKKDDINLICRIAVFGLLLFFILWEARSRYILNYLGIFVIIFISSLKYLNDWIIGENKMIKKKITLEKIKDIYSKVKAKFNKILDKLNNKFQKLYSFFFEKKAGKILLYSLGIILISIYIILYFFKEPIVDEEVRPQSINNLIPWEIKEGENFLLEIFKRPFNLNITEVGQYRPRYLAFFTQCLEENIFLKLVRAIPAYGNRAPFYPIAMICVVLALVYFIKTVWNKSTTSFAFFISSFIPLFQNFQVTTYWRARSAKIFTLAVCIFLIGYCIRHLEEEFKLNKWYKTLLAIPFFMLMTLDEQVLALVMMLVLGLIIVSIIDKKVKNLCVTLSLSSIIYLTYHLFWGKALFLHFTGSLAKHGHTIEGAVTTLNLNVIKDALIILLEQVISKIVFLIPILFLVFWILFFCKIEKSKNKDAIKKNILAIGLLLIPIVILMMLISAHNDIYTVECLWKSVYILVPGVLLFLSFIYVIANSKTRIENLKPFILIGAMIPSFVYNINHIDEYYINYLSEQGGFITVATDMEITRDDILIDTVPEREMQYSNDSVIASLNTFFTDSDISKAKIIDGNIDSDNYISDYFSCYLITQKNRKLKINANIENYECYNSVSIYINKLEIANVPIYNSDVYLDLDVKTERYRAGKVTLIFHKKNVDYKDYNNVKIKEMYMY